MDVNNINFSFTAEESAFDVRLVSPISGFDFLGRVEVKYNNTWGTVCDNMFNFNEADVICNMLNYTRATCIVANARMGRGSGEFYLLSLKLDNLGVIHSILST